MPVLVVESADPVEPEPATGEPAPPVIMSAPMPKREDAPPGDLFNVLQLCVVRREYCPGFLTEACS
jgi:hypothetical protein